MTQLLTARSSLNSRCYDSFLQTLPAQSWSKISSDFDASIARCLDEFFSFINLSFPTKAEALKSVKIIKEDHNLNRPTLVEFSVANKSYILRLFSHNPSIPSRSAKEQEITFMQEAAQLGIGPQLHYVMGDFSGFVMDKVEGPLTRLQDFNSDRNIVALAKSLKKLASIQPSKKIHPPDFVKSQLLGYIEQFEKRFPHLKSYSSEVKEFYDKFAPELRSDDLTYGTIHCDLHPKNMFWQDGKLILIDWEAATFGPINVDLSRILGALAPSSDQIDLFFVTYFDRKPTAKQQYETTLFLTFLAFHSALASFLSYSDSLEEVDLNEKFASIEQLSLKEILMREETQEPVCPTLKGLFYFYHAKTLFEKLQAQPQSDVDLFTYIKKVIATPPKNKDDVKWTTT